MGDNSRELLDITADRDPHAHASKDPLETAALAIVKSALEERARSLRIGQLPTALLASMMSAAQAKLRTMTKHELASFSTSSSQFQSITETSFNAIATADPQRLAALQKINATGGDGTDGDPTRLARGADELRARISSAERSREMGGERVSTEDRVQIANATAMAMRLGMPWALNNPDLLRLGPSTIKTLHEASVQRERFERMTGDKVGFRAATAVEIAAFAKRHNLTPEQTNRLYDKISDGVEVISGGNKGIQRELDEATRKYVTGPDTPEARQALEEAWKRHADTPEKKQAAEVATQALIKPTQHDAKVTAERNVDAKQTQADEVGATKKVGGNDAALAGLNAPAEPATAKPAQAATKAPVVATTKAISPKTP